MALAPSLSTSRLLALDSAKTCQSEGVYIHSLASEALACVVGVYQMIIHQIESSLEVCGLPSAKDGPATST